MGNLIACLGTCTVERLVFIVFTASVGQEKPCNVLIVTLEQLSLKDVDWLSEWYS